MFVQLAEKFCKQILRTTRENVALMTKNAVQVSGQYNARVMQE
jgi:hypothetical protein